MQRWIGPALAGLLILGAGTLWLERAGTEPRSTERPDSVPVASNPQSASSSRQASAAAAQTATAAPQAPSWNGTTVDGDIHLDDRGNIIPDRALRNLFDYLLTARGELSMGDIKQRLLAIGQAHALNAAQLTQLSADFNRYLDYLTALPQVALTGTDADSLRRTYEARKALRRGVLGIEMAEGFFAEDEARDRYEIDTVAVQRDASLTPEARARALADLRQQAPPALKAAQQRSDTVVDLAAETERLRAAGAGADAIQALREREVGPEAAQRLAALDVQRAQWQQRLDAVRSERDRILADPSYAPDDRQRQVDALIARDFSEEESARVRAQLELPSPTPSR